MTLEFILNHVGCRIQHVRPYLQRLHRTPAASPVLSSLFSSADPEEEEAGEEKNDSEADLTNSGPNDDSTVST